MIFAPLLACTAGPAPVEEKPSDTATDNGDTGNTAADTADTGGTGEAPAPWEPFDTLDDARWDIATWTLGRSELAVENVSVTDGQLALHHEGAGDAWLGAEIFTSEAFFGGHWTAAMTPPTSTGTVCAFFFYGTDGQGLVHEIDVELLGGQLWVGTYANWSPAHGYENGPTREYVVIEIDAPQTFTISWGDTVDFLVDGSPVASFATAVPSIPLQLHLNHWTTDTWADVAYPPPASLDCRFDSVDRADE